MGCRLMLFRRYMHGRTMVMCQMAFHLCLGLRNVSAMTFFACEHTFKLNLVLVHRDEDVSLRASGFDELIHTLVRAGRILWHGILG